MLFFTISVAASDYTELICFWALSQRYSFNVHLYIPYFSHYADNISFDTVCEPIRRKTCPSVTLTNTVITRTGPGSSQGSAVRGWRLTP